METEERINLLARVARSPGAAKNATGPTSILTLAAASFGARVNDDATLDHRRGPYGDPREGLFGYGHIEDSRPSEFFVGGAGRAKDPLVIIHADSHDEHIRILRHSLNQGLGDCLRVRARAHDRFR